MEQKGKLAGLLPIGIFLVLFLGVGLVSRDFYSMPAIVAFLIALVVAFCSTPVINNLVIIAGAS